MQRAIRGAREGNPALALELDFIEKFLMLDFRDSLTRRRARRLGARS